MWPIVYAIVSTVSPKANATPAKPIPKLIGVSPTLAAKTAAKTALPQPPNTSQKVPKHSATHRFPKSTRLPNFLCCTLFCFYHEN
jgi:hypothetical protein